MTRFTPAAPLFDHCYTPDPGHAFFESLGERGFTLSPRKTVHPGPSICRFIHFQTRPGRLPAYLEFVSASGDSRGPAGFSFATRKPLSAYFSRINEESNLRPRFWHRNYKRGAGHDRRRLPGLNFITFAKACPGVYAWFTEYERPAAIIRRMRKVSRPHRNGCQRILGFQFEVNTRGRDYLAAILGRELAPAVELACGTKLYFRPAARTRLRAVILRTTDLARFVRVARPDRIARFHGRRAATISNPGRGWDIVAVE